jgi:hypothetical protein
MMQKLMNHIQNTQRLGTTTAYLDGFSFKYVKGNFYKRDSIIFFCYLSYRGLFCSSFLLWYLDGEDACKPEQFECANGQCMESSVRCNGRSECSDGSDEDGCPSTGILFIFLLFLL